MSFKHRGNFSSSSFTRIIHQSSVPELQELDRAGEEEYQYFGPNRRGRRGSAAGPGLYHQAGGELSKSRLCRDDLPSCVRGGRQVRPGREIYRPPTASWNIDAQEFQPLSPAPLTSSRSVDMTRRREASPDMDVTKLGTFGQDMDEIISVAVADPNRLSARSQMELVRQIFNRVVENPKTSELAAKFCIGIIEREKKETFLESLLNTSQEWYHERDRLLQPGPRWAAFMSFLNDLYGLLKRKQVQVESKYEGVAPKLVLLTLLAEVCSVTLTRHHLNNLTEVESLFLILTHIQRDLMTEAPGQMTLIVNCLREAFLTASAPPQVRKTLLQLLELQSAGWQLPAEAVMYYYPGAKL